MTNTEIYLTLTCLALIFVAGCQLLMLRSLRKSIAQFQEWVFEEFDALELVKEWEGIENEP